MRGRRGGEREWVWAADAPGGGTRWKRSYQGGRINRRQYLPPNAEMLKHELSFWRDRLGEWQVNLFYTQRDIENIES